MKHKPSEDDNFFLYDRCENISENTMTKIDGNTFEEVMQSLNKLREEVVKKVKEKNNNYAD